MSIAPPSDIILDVAQAGDPLKVQAATAKLARLAAGAPATDFGAVLDGSAAQTSSTPLASQAFQFAPPHSQQGRPASPYEKFEGLLLQSMLQNVLPKDAELFGDAASADACRSMLAEQLATQLAKSGRFGITREVEAAHAPAKVAAAPEPAPAQPD